MWIEKKNVYFYIQIENFLILSSSIVLIGHVYDIIQTKLQIFDILK